MADRPCHGERKFSLGDYGGLTMKELGLSRRKLLRNAALGTAALALPVSRATPSAAMVKTLNFYSWTYGISFVKQRITEFEKLAKVKINYGNTPGSKYRDALVVKLSGKTPLDVIYMIDGHLAEFVGAGWLYPIDEFPRVDEYRKEFIGPTADALTYNGKLYGLPYYVGHMAFLYNEEHLVKAGIGAPPKTWDEVVQQSLQIKSKGIQEYPYLQFLRADPWMSEMLFTMMYSRGGGFVDAKYNPTNFAQKGSTAEQTIQWLIDAAKKHKIMQPGFMELNEVAALKAFSSGTGSFAILPNYRLRAANEPKSSKVAGKIKMALMPTANNAKPIVCGWTRAYSMTASAAKDPARKAMAWKMVDFLGGKDKSGTYRTAKKWFTDFGLGFGHAPLFKDPDIIAAANKWGEAKLFESQMALSKPKDGQKAVWYAEWDQYMRPRVHKAILGQADIEGTLKTLTKQWNKLKRRYS
jgi:multiple sugar transport system substrate-binding protein